MSIKSTLTSTITVSIITASATIAATYINGRLTLDQRREEIKQQDHKTAMEYYYNRCKLMSEEYYHHLDTLTIARLSEFRIEDVEQGRPALSKQEFFDISDTFYKLKQSEKRLSIYLSKEENEDIEKGKEKASELKEEKIFVRQLIQYSLINSIISEKLRECNTPLYGKD